VKQKANTNGFAAPAGAQLQAQRYSTTRLPGQDLVVVIVNSAPASLTVVVADAQPVVRHGVRSVLERVGDIAVVGEAATAEEMVSAVSRHRPDVLIMDLDTGEPAGHQVIGQVQKVAPETGVLVFSTVSDDRAVSSAMLAGARGYLVKSAGPEQLLRSVHAVAAGEVIVGKAVADRFSALMRPAENGGDPYPFPQLTRGEREVLERIAAGKSNLAIARELAFAPKTISNRVSVIFGKLGVADRAQAIVLARNAGLGHG
jgi:DNA-binding NarL/FixJ family response regulator